MHFYNFSELAPAYPRLEAYGKIKQQPEHFIVTENLGFELTGQGEHVFLWIKKAGLGTQEVVKALAKKLKIKERDIACSGLKDKHAETYQWFSFVWPIKKPFDFFSLSERQWQVIDAQRHDKKLRRGTHKSNQFSLVIRELAADNAQLEKRLEQIKQTGFANYFGAQRFGLNQQNLFSALEMFNGQLKCPPFQRAMYYSAARSYLFNLYLNQRIKQNSWQQAVHGDCFNLAGSNSVFGPEPISEVLQKRLDEQDIHIAGPMLGNSALKLTDDANNLWQQVVAENHALSEALQDGDIASGYRALRCVAENLQWQFQGSQLHLQFELRAGSFATALINELVKVDDKS